ncbi:hypothetical protein D3C71_1445550 [compost metagenome]
MSSIPPPLSPVLAAVETDSCNSPSIALARATVFSVASVSAGRGISESTQPLSAVRSCSEACSVIKRFLCVSLDSDKMEELMITSSAERMASSSGVFPLRLTASAVSKARRKIRSSISKCRQ